MELTPDMVRLGFFINRDGHDQAEDSKSIRLTGLPLDLQGLCTAIAIGFGEASKPHIDCNDDPGMFSIICQLSGPPGYTYSLSSIQRQSQTCGWRHHCGKHIVSCSPLPQYR